MLSTINFRSSAIFICSLLLVAFGQPAFISFFGFLASLCGYTLFFTLLLPLHKNAHKFYLGTFWFFIVQLIQLDWFLTHPYIYIYPVYFLLALILASQFGFLSLLINRQRILSLRSILALASFWTIMEWARLFIFSGFSFNPIGLSMTGSLYAMQLASLVGVYGLTFWVMLVNLLLLRLLEKGLSQKRIFSWALFAFIPYVFGFIHYHVHDIQMHRQKNSASIDAILVQTAFPIEEALNITSPAAFISYVMEEWTQILTILKKQQGKNCDLIVLPEFVVPLGTYTFVYPIEYVKNAFKNAFGDSSTKLLPDTESPFAKPIMTDQGLKYFVNNAYWAKGISNVFNSPILLGLEDVEETKTGKRDFFSSAIYIHPFSTNSCIERYEKRVLVPMGEYIPFEWCKKLAAKYGVTGSFTCGTKAKVFKTPKFSFGASICYEETFGNIIRESKFNGAEVLVNLTSDVWYPDSRLTKQHFDHARLRTVESGAPLLRSCNTGITCGIDSIGNVIDELPEYNKEGQWLSDALHVQVPSYHYPTLYSQVGDTLIIGFCFLWLPRLLQRKRK